MISNRIGTSILILTISDNNLLISITVLRISGSSFVRGSEVILFSR